ncbi:hypothetical protein [Clostridium sp. UBA6640]|uniref:hypothetical protein n=1 Tax=Clostridium sp. UBA6640 TaxID=1946370 RepID=UPI0025C6E766|nr:hypothetical protein [Clostridium sp. UBA6640]
MNDKNFIGMGHNPNPNVPDIPEGFAMALLQEPDARDSFQNLSDEEKTNVIGYIQNNNLTGTDAKNKIDNAIKNLNNNSIDFINMS